MNVSPVTAPHGTAAAAAAPSKADMIDGLRKGLEVICAFDDSTPRLTQSELAHRLDLSRAAARRYLMTLTALGYMATDGKSYWLTPKVMRLGHSYVSSARLLRTVQPFLQKLTETLGESTSLAVLEDENAVYVTRASAAKLLSPSIEPGTRLPAHTTAAGRILLSQMADAALDQWLESATLRSYTPHTTTDKPTFRRELLKMRKQGYAATDGQYELGLRGIAVPLLDGAGAPVGALSVSMSIATMTPAAAVRYCVPPLRAVAEQLRAQL